MTGTPAPGEPRPPANVDEALALVARMSACLEAAGRAFRAPPPVPTTCCGRGCAACVWQGYFEALLRWRDDARAVLKCTPCRCLNPLELSQAHA
ncbi:MAG: oxidoreductase [Zoogloeaceae bacterium]|nr:oxidoreductase [Zoogloeaceae bacterium]